MTTPGSTIEVRGARTHNLRNVDVDVPRDRLVVITGLSGSGKSSLAFDTLFAEGQRRYLETLSAQARQFVLQLPHPEVDSVRGLPPTIAVEQRVGSARIRSTLATTTEIYDYLRLLYARAGQAHCPDCGVPVSQQSVEAIVTRILALEERQKVMILAPLVTGRKGSHREVFEKIGKAGLVRARVNGEIVDAADAPDLPRSKEHTIEVIVDRIIVKPGIEDRLKESVELALKHGDGSCLISQFDGDAWNDRLYSSRYCCPECGTGFPPLEPRTFSFNSPYGACPACRGLGVSSSEDEESPKSRSKSDRRELFRQPACGSCGGARLGPIARAVTFAETSLPNLAAMSVDEAAAFFTKLTEPETSRNREGEAPPEPQAHSSRVDTEHESGRSAQSGQHKQPSVAHRATAARQEPHPPFREPWSPSHELANLEPEARLAANSILPDIASRLRYLQRVGVGYLTLNRPAPTLSGGEFQRARLASCLGSGLIGVCYLLDEPTIGLHPRDTARMLEVLTDLRDRGNSVLVVEHDEELIRRADWLIDLGPGAGREGGQLVASGTVGELLDAAPVESQTVRWLASGSRHEYAVSSPGKGETETWLRLDGASLHNLKEVSVEIPLGTLTAVTGVSGSGKTSLVTGTLVPALKYLLPINSARRDEADADWSELGIPLRSLTGSDCLDRIVVVDQSPIGRSGRSNPATHSGVWNEVRRLFAKTRDAKLRGFKATRFSFNAKDGRCPTCEGRGEQRIELNYLPDASVECPDCLGARFNSQTLGIRFKEKNLAEVLSLRIDEAATFFENVPKIRRVLDTLREVGLGYLQLGQSSLTLSGGEAQRVKLATELCKGGEDRVLFVLDEPTTGLHPVDVERLLQLLRKLVEQGHSVLVVEHNLDVISGADWMIDLGPDGGGSGGEIIAAGRPGELAKRPGASLTAQSLGQRGEA
jgi:excinuclease ABC subunit A